MTNEEAIRILKSKMDGSIDTSYEWAETVRMAITALEAQDVDAVSRKAVMWMLTNLSYTQCRTQGEAEVIGLAKTLLIAMPSVQKVNNSNQEVDTPTVDTPTVDIPTGDVISRQAAIDALADYIRNVDKVYSTGLLSQADCEDAALSVLKDLPSAQPDIIRCKDCKYFIEHRCRVFKSYDWRSVDDYCSYAERRTDEPDKQTD